MYLSNSQKSTGSIVTIVGLCLYLLGVLMLFDRLLILLGNILFLIGTGYIVGTFALVTFFVRPTKMKGSLCYFSGLFLILVNWAVLGSAVQLVGLFYLFRDFLPQLYSASKYIPAVGPYICNSPFLNQLVGRISGTKANTI
mmetsp:Transcript_4791/g.7216  ORF Transcript_4791/g.7216 Transcript_4791/m.7216 type:complete len:141 (-) Transcript_4791:808-1230(-)